ncbi:ABC-three component system middle component 7 [Luteibacter sp. CQ10]|uniref:ABC-three component system middle component 7 n=1 Tax=Luteibacter sp. CQ10 TaxID=2805821 RepID=UPI0034A3C1B7
MIVPNKVVSLNESALGLAPIILAQGPDPISPQALFERVEQKFESIDQFLLTLDLLYVLNRIDLSDASDRISYVG